MPPAHASGNATDPAAAPLDASAATAIASQPRGAQAMGSAPAAARSTLLRLMARLGGGEIRDAREVRDVRESGADRLAEWTRWTDAIALAAALSVEPGGAASHSATPPSASALAAECARLHEALAAAPTPGAQDLAAYRRGHAARQQAMETAIGALRQRLRAALAAGPAAAAQLAAVDAVMEQVLQPQEQRLLARLVAALEKHFKRLHEAAEVAGQAGEAEDPQTWRRVFQADFEAALQAELEFRWQPVEGLLEALRAQKTS